MSIPLKPLGDIMLADFIGGPWHLTSRFIPEVRSYIRGSIAPPVPFPAFIDPKETGVPSPFDVIEYKLTISTPTFCVYVCAGVPVQSEMYDAVRYFFGRENRFREELIGWTHRNEDLAAAAVEGLRGILAIQRFRKSRD